MPDIDSDTDDEDFSNDTVIDALGNEEIKNGLLDSESMNLMLMGESANPIETRNIQRTVESGLDTVNTDLDNWSVCEDIDHDALYFDYQKLGTNVYAQMCTNGYIGSAHSSSVRLRFKETPEEFSFNEIITIREIEPCRRNMNVCGGHGYMPLMIKNFLIDQRENTHLFGALPLLLSRILVDNPGSFDGDKAILYEELQELFDPLENILNEAQATLKKSGCNTIWFEFFFMSTLDAPFCDMIYPTFDYSSCMKMVLHDEYSKRWYEIINEYLTPVLTVMDHLRTIQAEPDEHKPALHKFSPELKTSLLFCMEVVVSFFGIIGFRGRIMKAVQEAVGDEEVFWRVPPEFKTVLCENEQDFCHFGLDPTLLKLPDFVRDTPITELNLKKTPSHIQSLRGLLKTKLTLPVGYFSCISKVQQILFRHDRRTSPLGVGFFEKVDFHNLATQTEASRKRMFDRLACVCAEAYTCEWWFIVNERTTYERNNTAWTPNVGFPRRLVDFPQTVDSFHAWVALHGTSWIIPSTNFIRLTPQVVDPGISIIVYLFFVVYLPG